MWRLVVSGGEDKGSWRSSPNPVSLLVTFAPTEIEAGRFKMNWSMNRDKIVPDIIDQVPGAVLRVRYGNGTEVFMGNELTPTTVKDLPTLISWPSEPRSLYTLIMADLDAPSRADPKDREGLHWLVVNIPDNKINSGETFTEYIGSGSPQGTGLHRYVFLVFKQPGRLTLTRAKTSNHSAAGRFGFKTRDFAKEHKLVGPVAGNYFQAQYDDYVPILHAQLAGNGTSASA